MLCRASLSREPSGAPQSSCRTASRSRSRASRYAFADRAAARSSKATRAARCLSRNRTPRFSAEFRCWTTPSRSFFRSGVVQQPRIDLRIDLPLFNNGQCESSSQEGLLNNPESILFSTFRCSTTRDRSFSRSGVVRQPSEEFRVGRSFSENGGTSFDSSSPFSKNPRSGFNSIPPLFRDPLRGFRLDQAVV